MKLFALHISYSTKLWFIHSFPFLFGPDPQIYADPYLDRAKTCGSGSETLVKKEKNRHITPEGGKGLIPDRGRTNLPSPFLNDCERSNLPSFPSVFPTSLSISTDFSFGPFICKYICMSMSIYPIWQVAERLAQQQATTVLLSDCQLYY